ncbi:terminase small subunit [Mycobacterium phage Kumao]|uniref:Terminase small subunit n=1 Tax=Mycobacterium phage Kumao TaxID=2041344 RepID=A0A2D1GPT4_9CAUD|nr:terminase small subunit [Mycobacterium phage Kumao]ATN93975.1 terminase small subunit [Mycobacterium phage Kumao]
MTESTTLDAAGYVILGEACRTADIIDRLNGALHNRHQEWIKLAEEAEHLSDGTSRVQIVVNPLLGEIRQQRLALRQLLAQLKLGKAEVDTGEPSLVEQLMEKFSLD